MKTPEEIQKIAEKEMMGMEGRFGFEAGYEKCQEDMADKKYTEEDMLFAFVHGGTKFEENKDADTLAKNFKELINSLNKQDNE